MTTEPTDNPGEAAAVVPAPKAAETAASRRVLRYAVLAGLCPLIPIPFLDDVLAGMFRARMIRGLVADAGLRPEPLQADLLAFEPLPIRLLGCLFGLIWAVVRKLFRKIVYIFAVKDCVDTASRVMHHGWLFQYALTEGILNQQTFDDGNEAIRHVRDAIRTATDRVDPRPVNKALRQVFLGSRSLVKGAARAVGQILRGGGANRRDSEATDRAVSDLETRQVGEVERILDELVTTLKGSASYRENLEREFREVLAEGDPGPSAAALLVLFLALVAGCGGGGPVATDGTVGCNQDDPQLRDVCQLAGVWDLDDPELGTVQPICEGMSTTWYRDMCWLASAQSPSSTMALREQSTAAGTWATMPVSPGGWDVWGFCEQIHDPFWVQECKLFLLDMYVGDIDPTSRLTICLSEMPLLQEICVKHGVNRWAEGMTQVCVPGGAPQCTSWFSPDELAAQLDALRVGGAASPQPAVAALARALLEHAHPDDWETRCLALPGADAARCRPAADPHQAGVMKLQRVDSLVWREVEEPRWW